MRRDRTRSPPRRRDYDAPAGTRHYAAHLKALFAGSLSIFSKGQQVQLRVDNTNAAELAGSLSFANRFNKIAVSLMVTDGAPGERAWSDPVPLPAVFSRLRTSLLLPPEPTPETSPTIADVDKALANMLFRPPPSTPAPPQGSGHDDNGGQQQDDATHVAALLAQDDAATGLGQARPTDVPADADPVPNAGLAVHAQVDLSNDNDNGDVQNTAWHDAGDPDDALATLVAGGDGIDALFCTPDMVELGPTPATRRQRQRRAFDMSNLRRSTRLANKPTMPAVEKAQRNLCRKLGVIQLEPTPLEEVVQSLLAMFTGPLPDQIIGAMTTIFDLDDAAADDITDALINHAGDSIDELRLQDLHLHDAAAA